MNSSGNESNSMICCTGHQIETDLPDISVCGNDTAASKILNGFDTEIDEYPWMVVIEFRIRKCICNFIS